MTNFRPYLHHLDRLPSHVKDIKFDINAGMDWSLDYSGIIPQGHPKVKSHTIETIYHILYCSLHSTGH